MNGERCPIYREIKVNGEPARETRREVINEKGCTGVRGISPRVVEPVYISGKSAYSQRRKFTNRATGVRKNNKENIESEES